MRVGDFRREVGPSHQDHGRVLHRQGGREHGAGGRDLGSFAGKKRHRLLILLFVGSFSHHKWSFSKRRQRGCTQV